MQDLREFRSGAGYDAQYGHLHKPEIQYLSQLASEQCGPILDICCGTGLVTIPIAEETSFPAYGVDIAEDMIAYAKEKSKDIDNIFFHYGNALDFDLEQTFDLAFMTGNAFQAFLNVDVASRLLANIHRHLNMQGLLVFNTRLLEYYDLSIDNDFNFKYEYIDESGIPVKYFSKKTRFDSAEHILYSDIKREYPDGRVIASGIELKFIPLNTLLSIFEQSGFECVKKYAAWDLSPFNPKGTSAVFKLRKTSP